MDQAVKLCGYSNKMINLWTQTRNSAEITSCACIFPVSPSCLHTFLCITSRSVPFVSLTPTSEQVWSPTFESMLFVFHSCNAPTVCRDCGSEGGGMYVSVSVDVCVWCKWPQVLTHAPEFPLYTVIWTHVSFSVSELQLFCECYLRYSQKIKTDTLVYE